MVIGILRVVHVHALEVLNIVMVVSVIRHGFVAGLVVVREDLIAVLVSFEFDDVAFVMESDGFPASSLATDTRTVQPLGDEGRAYGRWAVVALEAIGRA